MNIRPAQARDLEACLAIDGAYETDYVWQMDTSRSNGAITVGFRTTRLPRRMRVASSVQRELLLEHFEQGECFLVAEDASGIYAYLDAAANRWSKVGWIYHLTVAPERRRRGIASLLLSTAIKWARTQDLRELMVEAPTKNYPASALFQKHGFAFCGFNDHYYPNRDIALFFGLSLR